MLVYHNSLVEICDELNLIQETIKLFCLVIAMLGHTYRFVALLMALSPATSQFFDDYSSETEYKGKFIGTLNSYHHQVNHSCSKPIPLDQNRKLIRDRGIETVIDSVKLND